jgi:hypothetical protein
VVKPVLLILGAILTATIIAAGIWARTPDRTRADLGEKYWDSSTGHLTVGGTSLRIRSARRIAEARREISDE